MKLSVAENRESPHETHIGSCHRDPLWKNSFYDFHNSLGAIESTLVLKIQWFEVGPFKMELIILEDIV